MTWKGTSTKGPGLYLAARVLASVTTYLPYCCATSQRLREASGTLMGDGGGPGGADERNLHSNPLPAVHLTRSQTSF